MKLKYVVWIVLLVMALVEAEAARQYRNFTNTEGKEIRGCVLAYDEAKGIVTFERDNRRTAKVPIAVFSEKDQEYIKKWNKQQGVRSTSKFKISCDRRTVKNWTKEKMGSIHYTDGSVEHDQVTGKMTYEETAYEIVLVNRNNYAVTDLILEYCIYYEQQVNSDKDNQQGIQFGSISIDKLAKNEKKEILSKSVVTYKDESNASFLNARVMKGDVFGIAMRLYVQDGNEKILVREMAVPDSVIKNREWSTSSVNVGKNR